MGKFTKFLCLNLALALLSLSLQAKWLRFKGDYFIYSDDINYLYGSGNITLKPDKGNIEIKGDVLYLRIGGITGVIYGNVRVIRVKKNPKDQETSVSEEKYDAVFFKGVPPQWLMVSYKDEIEISGDLQMKPYFKHFEKKTPEELKRDSSLYFEFRQFRINENRRIIAKIVIPYAMGLPTFPLRRFTVRRGAWSDRTLLAFRNINYSGIDGLSVAFYLRMREKFLKGDNDIKIYERKLFGLEGPKRGILFSGKNNFLSKNKNVLEISTLLNSGEKSYNLRLSHRMNLKFLSYSFSQVISGQENRPTFVEFASDMTINKLKILVPRFQFTYDWEKSYSFRFSTPLNLLKNLKLNTSWQRKIIRDNYRSDTSDFSTSLHFNASLFSLSSNYNFSKNLVEAAVRKNFSVNLRLKPLRFLMDNISMDIASFYMFSSLPYGEQTLTRISPGLNFALRSAGARLPLGFILIPTFTLNHLWDNREEDFTDFNYALSLEKEIGIFRGSVDYTLASRYRAENFWIEGSNRQNLNLNLQLNDQEKYTALMRFYFNNNLDLENISFTGQWNIFYDLRFSSFLLYYTREKKFQTLEIFIEKTFKKRIKIQGGYSLALKRFFIKFLTL
ncbi:MAG: hypothetical protein PVH61_17165 [Candidatus Aminicenantes bacterium]|jgi:hypothetical protein